MAKYNHLGYLTILYSIGIPSFNRLVHQKMLIWPSKIFCTNLSSNPLIQEYITNIEKPNPTHGLCVLSSSIVEEILAKTNIGERPFSSMDVEPFIQNLSLLFDMRPENFHNFDNAFEIEKLTRHNNDNPFKTERLLVQEDGMCTNPTLNMSLEKALFPFLFSHGCGAYDGIGGLLPYLK